MLRDRLDVIDALQVDETESKINQQQLKIVAKLYTPIFQFIYSHKETAKNENGHKYLFIIDGIMEILIQNIFVNATGRLEVKDLINKIPEIETACKKEIELRLKTITTEFDLKFSKN